MTKKNYEPHQVSRRSFLVNTGLIATSSLFIPHFLFGRQNPFGLKLPYQGPASRYRARLKVAFVRREEEYGMLWPGKIYDGEAAFKKYFEEIEKTGQDLNMDIQIKPEPIYSLEEGENWLREMIQAQPDGLLMVALDRQQHTWPTITKAIDCGLPTVVFSPLGTSFTTNTGPLAHKKAFICSTDNFSQAASGMKMIRAGARLRETRYLVIMKREREDVEILPFKTKLRYLPADEFISIFRDVPVNKEVKEISSYYMDNATQIHGATKEDVQNGIRSYLAAIELLDRENADAITMDCLGVLGPMEDSLPCLAWSRLNDEGIPAACEADLGASITHAIVQYLFDKPGFQQDPVAETSMECLIGSHCSCPTKLSGFKADPEPFSIVHHHGVRDATAKTEWKIGQRITVADLIISDEWILRDSEKIKGEPKMYISAGEVIDNKSIPPSGGCVVAPMVKLDGVHEMLDYPGFHQIFFYGDHKRDLKNFCRLYGIEPVLV
jgi:hypothetical protein